MYGFGYYTAIVQAVYPGFSRRLTLPQIRMKAAIYHGIARRKKPMRNLQENRKHNIYKTVSFISVS